MDIKIIEPTPTETEVLEDRDTVTLEGGEGANQLAIATRQVLELGHDDQKTYEGDINTLIEWAKEKTGSDDPMEIKWAIRDLQLKIGTPAFGDRIKNLARFAYLDIEENRIKKEKSTFR